MLERPRVGGLLVSLCLCMCLFPFLWLRTRKVVVGCIFRSNYRVGEAWKARIEEVVKRLLLVSAASSVMSDLEVTVPGSRVYLMMSLARLVVSERSRGMYLRCLRLTEW